MSSRVSLQASTVASSGSAAATSSTSQVWKAGWNMSRARSTASLGTPSRSRRSTICRLSMAMVVSARKPWSCSSASPRSAPLLGPSMGRTRTDVGGQRAIKASTSSADRGSSSTSTRESWVTLAARREGASCSTAPQSLSTMRTRGLQPKCSAMRALSSETAISAERPSMRSSEGRNCGTTRKRTDSICCCDNGRWKATAPQLCAVVMPAGRAWQSGQPATPTARRRAGGKRRWRRRRDTGRQG
mmetsp:Transcript_9388/g.27361  ORF Transcript_9388/g.27361 Transcript_9388/m.27361 type:complete len:244 (+) Transcript_9388:171-902(+)